jgi:hypothetical protein
MAATDLTDLETAAAYVGLEASDDSARLVLSTMITAASEMLDRLCGPIINRTITGEKLDGGKFFVRPEYVPIFSVTSVVEYQATTAVTLTEESNTAKPANGFIVEDERIIRRAGDVDWYFADGRNNIVVTYIAGRGTAAATRFEQACLIVIRNLWIREKGYASSTFGDSAPVGATFALPNAAVELLRDDIRTDGVA